METINFLNKLFDLSIPMKKGLSSLFLKARRRFLGYNLSTFKYDLFGGLTTAITSLPLALAFGVASGLGPAAGIYGAIITGILAAMFGGTSLQITGPTAPVTVLIATVVGDQGALFAFGVIVLAGIFQIIFGLIKLGQLIEFLPYPVISGFMTGVAILIVKSQFGVIRAEGLLSIAVVIATIFVIQFSPRLMRSVPGQLIALILLSGVVKIMGIDMVTIGSLPRTLPIPNLKIFGIFSLLPQMLIPALSLSLLASIDTLLTAVIADNMTGKQHNSNKELIGQGIGNMFSGMFGGLAGAGATVRTLVNVKLGSKTRLSGILCGFFILTVLLVFGNITSFIPLAVLAGILVYTAINIIDYEGLKSIHLAPKEDTFVMFITIIVTVVEDLVTAVTVGIMLSAFLFLRRISDLEIVELSVMEHAPESERKGLGKYKDKIGIFQINGPLFFGAATKFIRGINIVHTHRVVILKMFAVTAIDQTGIKALFSIVRRLKENKVAVIVTNLQKKTRKSLERSGLLDEIGMENIFENPKAAIEHAKKIVDSQKKVR